MNWKGILGLIFICLGVILSIVAMATLSWATESSGGVDWGYGLVQYSRCDDNGCHTKALSDLNSGDYKDALIEGGKRVIAAGIVSLVAGVAGFVMLWFAYKRKLGQETHSAQRSRTPNRASSADVASASSLPHSPCPSVWSARCVRLQPSFVLRRSRVG
jgi:hypothetical protein